MRQNSRNLLGKPATRVVVAAASIVVLTAGAFAAWHTWRSHTFNNWVLEDAGKLTPYGVVVFPGEPQSGGDALLDQALTRKTLEGRLAVQLSRSEYYRGFGDDEAWVKTVLITAKPGDETAQRKIKLLHHLRRVSGEWTVISVEELAIP